MVKSDTSHTPLLNGVKILDLTRVLAGPFCTMLLGDLGADVIKVEEPTRGDDTRQWGPPFTKGGMSAYFISANRNKRSLTLDIKSDKGIGLLKRLIGFCDVFVENFKVGTLERLGLGYEEMKKIKPDLIYCTITGYGYTGPDRDKPGYDFIAQARGGLMSITGEADGEPMRVGLAITDILAGLYASNAIVAALFARDRQNTGQRIDISLFDAQVGTLAYVASNYLVSGDPPKRYGNAHPNIVPYQSFTTSDGYIAFAAGNDLQWQRFCSATGKGDWASDQRFATNAKRVENRGELISMMDELFRAKTTAEWLAICENSGVPAGPINTIDQVISDPQVLAREMVTNGNLSSGENINLLSSPLKIPTAPAQFRFPPPTLGEHTSEILTAALGLSTLEVDELKRLKVV